jgi:hypothetical protein
MIARIKIPCTLVCLLLLAAMAFGAPLGPRYYDIRCMGMGNTTVAVTTDRTAIFHNPAGLGLLKDKFEFSLTPLLLSVDGKLLTYLSVLNKQKSKLTNIANIDSSFFNAIGPLDGYWAGIKYAPEISMARKNLGFGIYSTFPLDVRIETGHFIPKLGVMGQGDLVVTGSASMPIVNENNLAGLSLKVFERKLVPEQITSYTETFLMFDKISQNPLGALNDLATTAYGASIDVGLMHDFNGLRLAYDMHDLLGFVGSSMIIPRFDVGTAYYFPQLEKMKWIRDMIASVEFSNLFGFEPVTHRYEHFGKKIHAGAEVDVWLLALRGGINQGYPTFGLGVSFGLLDLNYVYFTEELGYFPGQMPRDMHVFSMNFKVRLPQKNTAE